MQILQKPKYQFFFFLAILFVINLLQSYFTALFEDEAYYWLWAQDLALGYFDHPPLVAIWAKIGGLFFEGTLGVRFFSTISFSLMLLLIWKLIDFKEKYKYVWLYFLLIISLAFLNVFGFITTPDTPLMLFVALYLFAYKSFLNKESLFKTALLGIAMAGMMYSKYHGVLLVFFTVLSNFKLLKSKKFWLAGIFGLVLFLPHLYWQYINDFPSFRYHLFDRSKKAYRIDNTLLHIVNQFVIVGLTFPVVYYAFFKQKAVTPFLKTLKYITYGFILFFFISSFSSATQAQWTAAILIPLAVITFPYFIQNLKARKWLIRLGLIQLLLLMVARVFLANEKISPIVLEPHVAQTWIPKLKKKTNGKPIVFVNSYRNAALYHFNTGIKTHSYSVLKGRKSQFDLLHFEEEMQNKDVFGIGHLLVNDPIITPKGDDPELHGKAINNYQTFQKVKCIIAKDVISLQKQNAISFTFENTYAKDISFDNVQFIGVLQGKKNKILRKIPLQINDLGPIAGNSSKELTATFTLETMDYNGPITFRIALEFYDLLEGYQGNKVKVQQ